MQENLPELLCNVRIIHLIGIGGVGMAGLAEILLSRGYDVRGSDTTESGVTARLINCGATIWHRHDGPQVNGAELVITSSAISEDNSELIAARSKGLKIVHRGEVLAALMRPQEGIAISGCHGKTTTTALITHILRTADLDPSFALGGMLKGSDLHAYAGSGKYFVAEADESDQSFLLLEPQIAVVTNIDDDHLCAYDGEPRNIDLAFRCFLARVRKNGFASVCGDDLRASLLANDPQCRIVTYGLAPLCDIRATEISHEGLVQTFTLHRPHCPVIERVLLNLPGLHNVRNALAAISVASELGIHDDSILRSLATFPGVKRRLDVLVDQNSSKLELTILDDYGHHPTEIAATLAAIHVAWPNRRVVLIFQPHRYTRTRDLLQYFAGVLCDVKRLIITDVYSAGEQPIDHADGLALFAAIRNRAANDVLYVASIFDLPNVLDRQLRRADVVVFMGAGNLSRIAHNFARHVSHP